MTLDGPSPLVGKPALIGPCAGSELTDAFLEPVDERAPVDEMARILVSSRAPVLVPACWTRSERCTFGMKRTAVRTTVRFMDGCPLLLAGQALEEREALTDAAGFAVAAGTLSATRAIDARVDRLTVLSLDASLFGRKL
jgi:hypothetical protein